MQPVGLMEAFARICKAIAAQSLKYYGPRLVSVAVYGSVGRGTPRRDSDVDVLLVVNRLPKGRMPRMAEFAQVEQRLNRPWSNPKNMASIRKYLPLYALRRKYEEAALLLLDMTEDARILWDADDFLEKELGRLRQRLAELGARRIPYRGAWYWLLKDHMEPGEVFRVW